MANSANRQIIFIGLITKMRSGHRRTESDNYVAMSPTYKLHLHLHFDQNKNQISNLLKKSNRKSLSKTVCVESLDLPWPTSEQNRLFFFGRKRFDSPAGLSTQYDEDALTPIFQKKSSSHRSLKKSSHSELRKTFSKDKGLKSKVGGTGKFYSSAYLTKGTNPKLSKFSNSQSKKDEGKGKILAQQDKKCKLTKSRLRKKMTQP